MASVLPPKVREFLTRVTAHNVAVKNAERDEAFWREIAKDESLRDCSWIFDDAGDFNVHCIQAIKELHYSVHLLDTRDSTKRRAVLIEHMGVQMVLEAGRP